MLVEGGHGGRLLYVIEVTCSGRLGGTIWEGEKVVKSEQVGRG